MNIKILDSWFREYLKTSASPKQIADCLSLTSVSVDRIIEHGNDFIYDIEVTTNRPDLMSVVNLAQETAAILPEFGIKAAFKPLDISYSNAIKTANQKSKPLVDIKNDPKLVNRICAVIMEVEVKESPQLIKNRLEASGIRSLNNLIDITNYVMKEIGHPAHVFDYDRLNERALIIRESKKGEKIITLDGKEHELIGGDIVADNGKGEIVDLLGVMGTANSVVTNSTKRILFFIDNNEPTHNRRTSMSLGIRSEAAILNEKGVDPELTIKALHKGIDLFKQYANGRVVSEIIDIYPNKPKKRSISVNIKKISDVIGVDIGIKKASEILSNLGFEIKIYKDGIETTVPSSRLNDILTAEDLIEEIARVYGYHRIPTKIPALSTSTVIHLESNEFYWVSRIKHAFKYWGFTEVYTYSIVSEDLLEASQDEALKLQNPLTTDMVYMRKTLVPSLLAVTKENDARTELKLFEISNVYNKRKNTLPDEILMMAGVVKKPGVSFFEVKGLIEQLFADLRIADFEFKEKSYGAGADIYIGKKYLGEIENLDETTIDFEVNAAVLINNATLKKIYKQINKYPPIIEDVSLIATSNIKYSQIVDFIKRQSSLIFKVELIGQYKEKKTFRITYQDPKKNLTNEEVGIIRDKLYKEIEKKFKAKIA